MNLTTSLVLASSSPRRAALLEEAGIAFEPLDPGVKDGEEEALAARWRASGLAPGDVARRLAVTKALAASRLAALARRDRAAILAADTVVALDGKVLGKPKDRADAKAMIQTLAGREVEALTETSRVSFRKLDEATLESFIASGTWAGKAGSYGIQDAECQPLVASIEGSRSNVVGLPVERVKGLLARGLVALLLALGLTGCPEPPVAKNGSQPSQPAQVKPDPAREDRHDPKDGRDHTGHDHSGHDHGQPNVNRTPRPEEGKPNSGLLEVPLTISGATITAEVAATRAQRALGLMHRSSMPEDRGMLFVYPAEEKDFHNFWMRNTRIPLSIAYLRDDGTIVNVEDMEAFDETSKHPSKEKVRLALEMNKGWFKVHGVGPGARVEGIGPDLLGRGE